MNRRYINLVDRILSQCVMEDVSTYTRGACWSWQGAVCPKGYGRVTVRVNGKPFSKRAHRLLYELVRGALPENATLDHTCYNRQCCNPQHLEIVTRDENTRRARERARFFRESRTAATI